MNNQFSSDNLEVVLNTNDFDVKQWIQSKIESIGPTGNAELLLTQLLFSLQVIKSQSEQKIITIRNQIQTNQKKTVAKIEKIMLEFEQINEIISKTFDQKSISSLETNEQIFRNLNEMMLFKQKLFETIQFLSTIMNLQTQEQQISAHISVQNLIDIAKKIEEISEPLLLMQQLPKINPRYELSERILSTVINWCLKLIVEQFQTEQTRVSSQTCQIFHILSVAEANIRILEIYKSHRLQKLRIPEFKAAINKFNNLISINILELSQIVEIVITEIQKEVSFLSELEQFDKSTTRQHQIQHNASSFLREFMIEMNQIVISDFFQQAFYENNKYSVNSILGLHQVWLSYVKYIFTLYNDQVLEKKDFQAIIDNQLGEEYLQYCDKIIDFEKSAIKLFFSRKIQKDPLQLDSPQDKILDFQFFDCSDFIFECVQRVNEITFGTMVEEIILEISFAFQDYLQKFSRVIEEIEQNSLKDEVLDSILLDSHSKQKQTSEISLVNAQKNVKIVMGRLHSLFESLVIQFDEKVAMATFLHMHDKDIRKLVIENKSIYDSKVFSYIQTILCKVDISQQHSRHTLIGQIKNGDLVLEQIFNSLTSSTATQNRIITKIMISEIFGSIIDFNIPKVLNSEEDTSSTFFQNQERELSNTLVSMIKKVERTVTQVYSNLRDNEKFSQVILREKIMNSFNKFYFSSVVSRFCSIEESFEDVLTILEEIEMSEQNSSDLISEIFAEHDQIKIQFWMYSLLEIIQNIYHQLFQELSEKEKVNETKVLNWSQELEYLYKETQMEQIFPDGYLINLKQIEI